MVYTLEEIKKDLKELEEKEFYTKHIIRSNNWYFEGYMKKNPSEVLKMLDEYKLIISNEMNVSINSIMMVGSGKLGFSLTPPNGVANMDDSKTFKPFNDDETIRKKSDLDIAIISSDIFSKYWRLFRKSYKTRFSSTYPYIYQDLYRGYINERNIMEVDGCRAEWLKTAGISKRRLYEELYFKHEISFRIYRSWEDFEDYNLQNISKLKRSIE